VVNSIWDNTISLLTYFCLLPWKNLLLKQKAVLEQWCKKWTKKKGGKRRKSGDWPVLAAAESS
jgi:hypothetical protein